jgi:hypothetical protein
MSYRLPSPYNRNQSFSTQGQFRNPAGTNPLPQPTNMPAGAWFGNRIAITLKPTSAPDAESEVFWASPIFDLQPELRGLNPSGTTGSTTNNAPSAVPIWGSGGRLHVQISNLRSSASSLTNIVLTSSEFAHVSDSGKTVQALATSDITSQLQQETDSVILHYAPIGEGIPVRYWRVKLRFFRTEDTSPSTNPPTFFIDTGYY